MATVNTQTTITDTVDHTWTSAEYESALANLERLQEQLDALRSTIPSIIAPVLHPATSKAQMFAQIRQAAVQSTSNLKQFRNDWTSEQSQQAFTRTRQSLSDDDDLSRGSGVQRYGWSTK